MCRLSSCVGDSCDWCRWWRFLRFKSWFIFLLLQPSWLWFSSTAVKLWMVVPSSAPPSSTPSCQSPLSCATMWSWQVSQNLLFEYGSLWDCMFNFLCFFFFFPLPFDLCCRRWVPQCRAEGGSALVVPSSHADRGAVRGTKPHRRKWGETSGDRTQVLLLWGWGIV